MRLMLCGLADVHFVCPWLWWWVWSAVGCGAPLLCLHPGTCSRMLPSAAKGEGGREGGWVGKEREGGWEERGRKVENGIVQ